MSKENTPHFNPAEMESLPGYGITRGLGTTVPTDGAAGYSPGCLWQKLNGGVGTSLYVNEGTVTSCDFNAK